MNRRVWRVVLAALCLALIALTGCSSSPTIVTITATSGSDQTMLIRAAFSAPLVATVMTNGKPTIGTTVTFTAPGTGASAVFADGKNTDTETTDMNGVATSTAVTANTAGGSYMVTATVSGATAPASFSLTNTAATFYSFNLNGLEVVNETKTGYNYYALAGSVAVDAKGNVVAGEQDYNDGNGYLSPQPSGDAISGGTLTVDATGQGTLTLKTNNTNLGPPGSPGTEALGVQFVNTNHALIIQFDGSATSSGSMDVQTLPAAVSGNYAFTVSGVDTTYFPRAFGGIFSVTGGAVGGTADVNDHGTVSLANAISGAVTSEDPFGRGQITGISINGETLALNYYIVGGEVIRIIDVDGSGSGLGSAFGQGANASGASSASLGNSVFGVEGNSWATPYAGAGMLVPNSGAGTFTGIADEDEQGTFVAGSAISGTYTIASNGYGNLAITNAGLQHLTSFGLYLTDPTLNLLDPNNASGGGGALLVDLDAGYEGGTGMVIPQTDTATTSLTGNYAFGAQEYSGAGVLDGWEFDYIGQGSIAAGALTGTGLVSDPFGSIAAVGENTAVPFSGTATPDAANVGRYTMASLDVTIVSGSPVPLAMAIYQASGGYLFWVDEDALTLSLGTLQQIPSGSRAGLHARSKQTVQRKN